MGASVRRNEDRRLLDGAGVYLADLTVPGLAEVAFIRGPLAHGRIRAIDVPPRHRGSVFLAADIAFAKPIVAVASAGGFKSSEYPVLTSSKVRFAGDLIGMCVAPTRAQAAPAAARRAAVTTRRRSGTSPQTADFPIFDAERLFSSGFESYLLRARAFRASEEGNSSWRQARQWHQRALRKPAVP
jgi:CO/xanthine dehydrogenase Mo-binding subunit